MSAADYSQLSTDELIQRFIDQANHIGSIFSPTHLKVPFRSDEYERGKNALHAIGAELVLRKPVMQARERLFESESADVRGWAGGLLHGIDPEWAEASISGLQHDLSTRDVLAWRDRIFRGAPKGAHLDGMTIPQLLDRFIDACGRCYGSTRFLTDDEGGGTDRRIYNKVSGELYAVVKELNRREHLRELVPFLDHPFVTVRQKAALYCLPVAANEALAALKTLDAGRLSQESMEAFWTLDQWGRGKYRSFPYD